MALQHITLTLHGVNPDLTGGSGYVQVDGGPKVRIPPEDLENILVTASVLVGKNLTMTPVPGREGEVQSIRVPLNYPLDTYLPEACIAGRTPGPTEGIPGQIGALAMSVGGAEALAVMLGVTATDLLDWADLGVPSGPAKVLLVRLGEEYGLNLSGVPTVAKFFSTTERRL